MTQGPSNFRKALRLASIASGLIPAVTEIEDILNNKERHTQ